MHRYADQLIIETRYVLPSDTCAMISTRSVPCDPARGIRFTPFRGWMIPVVTDPSGWVTLISALLIPLPVKITVIFDVTGFFWTSKWNFWPEAYRLRWQGDESTGGRGGCFCRGWSDCADIGWYRCGLSPPLADFYR